MHFKMVILAQRMQTLEFVNFKRAANTQPIWVALNLKGSKLYIVIC